MDKNENSLSAILLRAVSALDTAANLLGGDHHVTTAELSAIFSLMALDALVAEGKLSAEDFRNIMDELRSKLQPDPSVN